MTVVPRARSSRMCSQMACRASASIPSVGSSMISSSGLCSNARARVTRRRMPPDRLAARSPARSARPISSRTSVMRRAGRASEYSAAVSRRFSVTVSSS
jgi:hypothetical protein